MNYGRYFRLNKNLSRIKDGFAIYDYIDLPAYFIASKNIIMSPKYPISIMVTSDSVAFRLHYSAYKIEDGKDSNYPQYMYESNNHLDIRNHKIKTGDTTKIVHMEEVILELPFIDTGGRFLSDIIRSIYNTNFPQMIGGSTSTGGRFLEQLINKRYPKEKDRDLIEEKIKEGDTETLFYKTLRDASDDTPSYSTLWLMDLVCDVKENRKEKRINLYDDNEVSVKAFLRKLLLDFMFDLNHSDVFQNSACYNKMLTGLTSNFYFSALMHKCEYYYCRKLILKEIESYEKKDNQSEVDKIRIIKLLYANNLFKAEKIWVDDIISPQAEREFDFLHPKKENPNIKEKHVILRLFSNIKSLFSFNKTFLPDEFRRWNSWFAPPEEEMKRVCFGMADEENITEIHICNTDTLATYLQITSNDRLDVEMKEICREIRDSISRWFLRRYDFHDTAYFHLSKFSNWTLVGGLLSLILILFYVPCLVMPDIFDNEPLKTLQHYFPLAIILLVMIISYIIYWRIWNVEKNRMCSKYNPLVEKSLLLSKHRITLLFSFLFIIFVFINNFVFGLIFVFILVIFAYVFHLDLVHSIRFYLSKIISSLHLLFPRLVASITTAWLTITLGFDLYVSFFDKPVSMPTTLFISFVIIMFILFEINRITPRVSLWKKTLRSVELLLISWCISILVGIVVIDFVGERFLERGGYVENYLTEYVVNEEGVEQLSKPIPSVVDVRIRASLIDDLENYKPIVTKFYFGEHEVFYMRDFLFMFSFITMFMGIFLQMFIFDDKKMTEF